MTARLPIYTQKPLYLASADNPAMCIKWSLRHRYYKLCYTPSYSKFCCHLCLAVIHHQRICACIVMCTFLYANVWRMERAYTWYFKKSTTIRYISGNPLWHPLIFYMLVITHYISHNLEFIYHLNIIKANKL